MAGNVMRLGGLAGMIALFACVEQPEQSLVRIRDTGVLRVAFALERPWAFRDSLGNVTGESIELIRALASELDVSRVEFVQTEFALLIPTLRDGRADVIASGMFVTPEREQFVRFATPHLVMPAALLVTEASDIRGLADLFSGRHRVAVIAGGVEGPALVRAGVPADQVLAAPDLQTALAALASGRASAVAVSQATGRRAAAERGLLVVPLPEIPPSQVALAVRLADRSLAERLNAALASYVGSTEHRAVIARFGFAPDNLPALPR